MTRYIFIGIALLHGLIHLMGFAKAFQLADITALNQQISRPAGVAWLVAVILFILAMIVYLTGRSAWVCLALPAVALSQVLIISAWQDARFGTVANIVIAIVAIASLAGRHFELGYRKDAAAAVAAAATNPARIITEADVACLPAPVQQYLRYCGVQGKPQPRSMYLVFEGQMRSRTRDWFPFRSEQYTVFADPGRYFFMKGKMHGFQVPGYHRYRSGKSSMQIRLFGLYPVVQLQGGELDKGELVTWFNELCVFAPAALVDKRIRWETVDEHSAKAWFTSRGITISAVLQFSDQGQLIDFLSEDRFETEDKKFYPFTTPIRKYEMVNGLLLSTYGETVWHYPEGDFTYGKFWLKELAYDIK